MAGGKAAVLALKILGDSKDATKALNEVATSTAKVEADTKKSGKAMGGVWASVAAAMGACVRQAAVLEQSTTALNVIFGEQAAEMTDWAEGMAQYGLSTAQAAGAAAVLGAQMKNTGLTTEQMVIATQGLIETSTQLAAVMGGSAVDAAAAMGAALRGEFDTLERYGISLTADAVATEAARLASEGFVAESEQQAKMVATLSLIQQQAAVIMGESTEQTVTATVATDHLKASIGNLAAAIGGPLLQVLTPLIEKTADIIDGFMEWWDSSEVVQASLDILNQILGFLAELLEALQPLLDILRDLFQAISDLLERTVVPILEALSGALDVVADALDTVCGWVEKAIGWFDDFTDSVREAIDALTFWNDTYDPNAASPSEIVSDLPESRRPGVGGRAAPQQVTVNVYASEVMDPYALARVVSRQLEQYAHVQGRRTPEPARAW